MDPRKLHTEFGLDERLAELGCAHCDGYADTVDHNPSKILLDDPLPTNLPVVPACAECNQGFSKDEAYLACFLECVIKGTVELNSLRPKIGRLLSRNERLANKIEASQYADIEGTLMWAVETKRVENVILKLARGHIQYELGYSQTDTPETIKFSAFPLLNVEERAKFENIGAGEFGLLPGEIGSRAFLRAIGVRPFATQVDSWVNIQPGRYRYAVDDGFVRIVISEYLACVVTWS